LFGPSFLYLQENPGELDDYACGAELFPLWSVHARMRKLLHPGPKEKLRRPDVLAAQTGVRCWPSPRHHLSIITRAGSSCTKSAPLPGNMAALSRPYYVEGLEEAMKQELRLFFKSILDGKNLRLALSWIPDFTVTV